MEITELLELIEEHAKPLECGIPVKVFFFRGRDAPYLMMEAMTPQIHKHVPFKITGEITKSHLGQYMKDGREVLEREFSIR